MCINTQPYNARILLSILNHNLSVCLFFKSHARLIFAHVSLCLILIEFN
jgi:hypothetical protein